MLIVICEILTVLHILRGHPAFIVKYLHQVKTSVLLVIVFYFYWFMVIVEFPCSDKKVYSYLFYVFPYRVSIKNSINMEAFIAPTRD